MKTYQERKESKKCFVLLKNKDVLGVFGSLKSVCDYMGSRLPSYWTLVRKKTNKYEFKDNDYTIHVVKPMFTP